VTPIVVEEESELRNKLDHANASHVETEPQRGLSETATMALTACSQNLLLR